MNEWKNIKIAGIVNIRKCVAEFEVEELEKTPYRKFKIKIYEDIRGNYTGYTNLLIKDKDGCPFSAVGHGGSVNQALENTIHAFLELLNDDDEYTEEDFECSDPYDF